MAPVMYEKSPGCLGRGTPERLPEGESDRGLPLGDGVGTGDAASENSSMSDLFERAGPPWVANAAAVAAAASSTVPVW